MMEVTRRVILILWNLPLELPQQVTPCQPSSVEKLRTLRGARNSLRKLWIPKGIPSSSVLFAREFAAYLLGMLGNPCSHTIFSMLINYKGKNTSSMNKHLKGQHVSKIPVKYGGTVLDPDQTTLDSNGEKPIPVSEQLSITVI